MSANKAAAILVLPACIGVLFFSIFAPIAYASSVDTSADAKCNPFVSDCSCGKVKVNGKCQFKGEKENMNGCSCQSDVKKAGGICIAKNNCLGTWYENQKGDKVPVEVPDDAPSNTSSPAPAGGQRNPPDVTGPTSPATAPQTSSPAGNNALPIADPSVFQYTPIPSVPDTGQNPFDRPDGTSQYLRDLQDQVNRAQANPPVIEQPGAPQKSFFEQTLERLGISYPGIGPTQTLTPVDANGNPIGEPVNASLLTNPHGQTTGFEPTDPLSAEGTSGCSGSWYCPLYETGKKAWDAISKEFGGELQAKEFNKTGDNPMTTCYGSPRCEDSDWTGRKMANGKGYDPTVPQVATRDNIPLGTMVEVCNGSRCVEAEVTDRLGRRDKASLDLNDAAARAIGFSGRHQTSFRILDTYAPVLAASPEPPFTLEGVDSRPLAFNYGGYQSPDFQGGPQWADMFQTTPNAALQNFTSYTDEGVGATIADLQRPTLTDDGVGATLADSQRPPLSLTDEGVGATLADSQRPPLSLTDEGIGATLADSQRPPLSLTDEGVGATLADSQRPPLSLTDEGVGATLADAQRPPLSLTDEGVEASIADAERLRPADEEELLPLAKQKGVETVEDIRRDIDLLERRIAEDPCASGYCPLRALYERQLQERKKELARLEGRPFTVETPQQRQLMGGRYPNELSTDEVRQRVTNYEQRYPWIKDEIDSPRHGFYSGVLVSDYVSLRAELAARESMIAWDNFAKAMDYDYGAPGEYLLSPAGERVPIAWNDIDLNNEAEYRNYDYPGAPPIEQPQAPVLASSPPLAERTAPGTPPDNIDGITVSRGEGGIWSARAETLEQVEELTSNGFTCMSESGVTNCRWDPSSAGGTSVGTQNKPPGGSPETGTGGTRPSSFTYTGQSVAQGLSEAGYCSSFTCRKEYARQLGIENYNGSSAQNIRMLDMLRGNDSALRSFSTQSVQETDNIYREAATKYPSGTSIVQFLNAGKLDSSFASRQSLYNTYMVGAKLGTYSGTAQQNIALLNCLRSGIGCRAR